MKNIILDTIGLAGFGLLISGVYLEYGLAKSLLTSGSLLLIFTITVILRGSK